jgi:hypothetical protein
MAHLLNYSPQLASVKTIGNGQSEKQTHRDKKAPKPFVGIDGESYTIEGDHRYVLLCAGPDKHVYEPAGLSTKVCFDFLLDQPRACIYAAFGLNYDVNMMLRDFGHKRLKELWVTGTTKWFNYHVEWIPGKWFQLTDIKDPEIYMTRKGKAKMRYRRQIKINEVFGFYQMAFVKALAKWKIDVQDGDELEAMKAARSVFDPEMVQRMISYCHTECELLATLLEALRDALVEAGVHNTSWNGAGSIAGAILRQEGVKYAIEEIPSREIQDAVLCSYFGGRTELFQQGVFSQVFQYDVVSAYPYGALSLPTLAGGQWIHTDDYSHEHDYALWKVHWEDCNLAPFPYRTPNHAIRYFTNGQGWYHTPEIRAALALYPDRVQILEGYVFIPSDETKPFTFVRELAKRKTEYKRVGHAAEKVLKLGINSLYGKLAQGLGYNDSKPPYQSYYWAGYITSTCRARMLSLASQAGTDHVIMVATDGIFLDTDPGWQSGDSLGDIERTILSDMFTVQPGVYHAWDGEGTEIKKSRGFFAKEIDFTQLRKGFLEDGPYFVGHYPSTRFLGLGSALQRRDMSEWRTWHTGERKLSLYPSGKMIDPESLSNPVRHITMGNTSEELSVAYVPKGGATDDEAEYMQGKEQPLRV